MRIVRFYFQAIFGGGFLATIPLVLFAEKISSDDQLEAVYGPALWSSLNIPFFVVAHEWCIEVFGAIRTTLRR